MEGRTNVGSSKVNPYKDEIKQFAQNAKTSGTRLFAGHKIDWMNLGDGRWEKFKNYIYSHVSSEYENAVREVFWEETNTKMDELSGSYRYHKSRPDDIARLVKETGEELKGVMESKDLTEGQKMELVLKAVGADIAKTMGTLKLGRTTGLGRTTVSEDTANFQLLLKEAGYDYAEKANEYFEGKKEKVLTSLGSGINLQLSQLKMEKIASEKDLKAFTQTVIETLANECKGDKEKIATLKENIHKLLAAEPTITLSPDIDFFKNFEVINTIDKIGLRAKGGALDKRVSGKLNEIRSEFMAKDMTSPANQKEYAEKIIKVMVDGCNGNAIFLTRLERSIAKMLSEETQIEDKKALIALVTGPRIYAEKMNVINTQILTQDLWHADQTDHTNQANKVWRSKAQTMEKIKEKSREEFYETFDQAPGLHERLTNLLNVYENEKTDATRTSSDLMVECLRAMMNEASTSKNSPKAVAIVKKNIEMVIEDPKLNFSEQQKAELKRDLMIEFKDVEGMKGILKGIKEREDISEGKKMELILMTVGETDEFKEIKSEKGISYFEEAVDYFDSIKVQALEHSQSTLLTDTESDTTTSQEHGVFYNQLSKLFTREPTFEDDLSKAASKKHVEFYRAIATNDGLEKKLAQISDNYKEKSIKSSEEFKKNRMDYNKEIIRTVIEAWPSLNIKTTRNLPDGKPLNTESLPLADMISALNDNIKRLGESSDPPLSQDEMNELISSVSTETARYRNLQ